MTDEKGQTQHPEPSFDERSGWSQHNELGGGEEPASGQSNQGDSGQTGTGGGGAAGGGGS